MSVQTTYTATIPKAYAGLVADNNPYRIITKICETVAGIPYGRKVSRGTSDDQAVIGGATGHLGIAVRVHNQENTLGTESQTYRETDAMAILQEGSVFLYVTTAGSPGDPLYSVDADGTIGAGAPGAGQTAIAGATLEETLAGAGLALCRFTA